MTRLQIGSLGSQGDGIALRAGDAPVFVPGAVPGDTIDIDAAGKVLHVHPGANRQVPPCQHFGSCGGCQMQHINDIYYHEWLTERLLSALAPVNITPLEIAPAHISPRHSRRRVSVKLLHTDAGLHLGFNAENSHKVVDLAECLIMHPDLWNVLQNLKNSAANFLSIGQAWTVHATLTRVGVDMTLHGLHQSLFKQFAKLGALAEKLGLARLAVDGPVGLEVVSLRREPVVLFSDIPVTLPPNSFLQATTEGEQALTQAVIDGVGTARKIADLFCGAGTFSLPLGKKATVLAVDGQKAALDALARAAQTAILPVKPLHQDLFRRPLRAEELNSFEAVVFDPPRAGAKEQALEIARAKVKTVVAVSCNPNTFARDAERLIAGGFVLTKLYPVGQFLWSNHVELVAHFKR
jgi:23S rRNA (uracil1939-C5)-methyltransferase